MDGTADYQAYVIECFSHPLKLLYNFFNKQKTPAEAGLIPTVYSHLIDVVILSQNQKLG